MIDYAIVQVLDTQRLIDGAGHEFDYHAPASGDLQPGYYAVFWPADVGVLRYDSPEALFCGPYRNTLFAKFATLDYLHRRGEVGTRKASGTSAGTNVRPLRVPASL